jgi:toxin FitB
MRYLLDTNLLSEPGKRLPDPGVLDWLRNHFHESGLAAISFAELRYGIERLPDSKRQRQLERELKRLLEDVSRRVLAFGEEEASEWGRYAAECEAEFGSGWTDHLDFRDSLVAATARAHGLPVVTRNVRHFPFVETYNPWTSDA